MKRWYRKTVVKVIAVIVGIVSGAVFSASLLASISLAGTVNPTDIRRILTQAYEDSEDFNMTVENSVYEIMNRIRLEQMFETDGAYNPDKLVDIMDYSRNLVITGANHSGVAYTLNELKDWGEDFYAGEGQLYDDNSVIVCEQPDGNYYYYYLEDFLALFDRGELRIEFDNNEEYQITQDEYLQELEDGTLTTSGFYRMRITDPEGNILYTDCWNFGESLREKYAPAGADNLLQVVNETPQLNGKLSIIYENIASTLSSLYDELLVYENGWEYLEEGNTNLTYIYANEATRKVVTNKEEYSNYDELKNNIREMKSGESVRYMIIHPKLKDFETNMNISESGEWDKVRAYEGDRKMDSVVAVAVDTSYPINDQFYEARMSYGENVPFLKAALRCMFIFGILFLVSVVWTAMAAGRKPEDNEVHLTSFDRCKTEIAAVLIIGIWLGVTLLLLGFTTTLFGIENWSVTDSWDTAELSYYGARFLEQTDMNVYSTLTGTTLRFLDVLAAFFYGLFSFGCFFAGYASFIKRLKGKTLWKNSLLRAVLVFGNEAFEAKALPARAAVLLAAFLLCQWAAIVWRGLPLTILAAAADGAAVWLVLNRAAVKKRIKEGIEEIASGNMSYQIDTDGIRGEDKALAEKVNDIGSGLNRAVDDAMRNERLKTDLITNVSHDIKTPLTSIINYVDILKRENIQDERIRGYLDILESKAQRLKILTEDVVEASKVSSGNISLEFMDVNFTEMIQQTEGEFTEKFAARNLMVVMNLPEEPAIIRVDGRRMWRVLENIFNNAVKYAMSGTRVYADLRIGDDKVEFSLKNVSEQQLNISADELTERFIRGDLSRSTEGSGLGLSIAKSLTVMQGGTFDLYLDGDLFRVNICFPRAK